MTLRVPIALTALGAVAALAVPGGPTFAQNPPEAEQAALVAKLADIDKLRVVNALDLTAEQVDQVLVVLRKAQDDADRKMAEATAAALKALSTDIEATYKKALAGEGVPAEFITRVSAFTKEMGEKRKQLDEAALTYSARGVRKVLTPAQIRTATQHAKKVTTVNGEPTMEGTDAQYFNLYVRETFLNYPRIVPLLTELKRARSGSASGS